MTEKEKLIDILGKFPVFFTPLRERWFPEAIERLADHLIANGIAVRTERVDMDIYDTEEVHTDCTVRIWTNSVTGAIDIAWWDNNNPPKTFAEGANDD